MSLGMKPAFSALSFQFNPAGHPVNRTSVMFGSLHDWLPYGDGTTYQCPVACQAESTWFKKFGIPPISGPERVGNWLELVVMIFFPHLMIA